MAVLWFGGSDIFQEYFFFRFCSAIWWKTCPCGETGLRRLQQTIQSIKTRKRLCTFVIWVSTQPKKKNTKFKATSITKTQPYSQSTIPEHQGIQQRPSRSFGKLLYLRRNVLQLPLFPCSERRSLLVPLWSARRRGHVRLLGRGPKPGASWRLTPRRQYRHLPWGRKPEVSAESLFLKC